MDPDVQPFGKGDLILLFRIEPVAGRPPQPARIHASLVCEDCGESTMETRTRRFGVRAVCIPCFERADVRT